MRMNNRNKKLIQTVAQLLYLTASQLAVPFFNNLKSARNTCQLLEKEGYLEHFPSPIKSGNGRTENVYHLSRKKKAEIQEIVGAWKTVTYSPPSSMRAFPHLNFLNEVLIKFLSCSEKRLTKLWLHPEHSSNVGEKIFGKKGSELQPDAQIDIEKDVLMLEVCRGTEGSKELESKFQRYIDLWDSGEMVTSSPASFRVLFVTMTEKKLAEASTLCLELETENLIYISTIERLKKPESVLFGSVWTIPERENKRYSLYLEGE